MLFNLYQKYKSANAVIAHFNTRYHLQKKHKIKHISKNTIKMICVVVIDESPIIGISRTVLS